MHSTNEVGFFHKPYTYPVGTYTKGNNLNLTFKQWSHLSKGLFLYFIYLASVTSGGPMDPEGKYSQVLLSTSVDSKHFESIKIVRVKTNENCKFVDLINHFLLLIVLLIQLLYALFRYQIAIFYHTLCGFRLLMNVIRI